MLILPPCDQVDEALPALSPTHTAENRLSALLWSQQQGNSSVCPQSKSSWREGCFLPVLHLYGLFPFLVSVEAVPGCSESSLWVSAAFTELWPLFTWRVGALQSLGRKEVGWKETLQNRQGRTATAMGHYPIFVLPSAVLTPTPHCRASHTYSLCGSSLTFTHCYLCSFSALHVSILPSSCSTPYIVLLCFPSLFCTMPSTTHTVYLMCSCPPLHMQTCCLSAPPAIYRHTQGQTCTNHGILALVSLPVKLLFLHIRPRQECRDIYETLFNVLKSHRLEHLGN